MSIASFCYFTISACFSSSIWAFVRLLLEPTFIMLAPTPLFTIVEKIVRVSKLVSTYARLPLKPWRRRRRLHPTLYRVSFYPWPPRCGPRSGPLPSRWTGRPGRWLRRYRSTPCWPCAIPAGWASSCRCRCAVTGRTLIFSELRVIHNRALICASCPLIESLYS